LEISDSDFTKSRSSRECMQVINDRTNARHQFIVVRKCLDMLLKDNTDGSRGAARSDLSDEWVIHQIFLCQCGILVQGRKKGSLKKSHMNTVNATGRTVEGMGER